MPRPSIAASEAGTPAPGGERAPARRLRGWSRSLVVAGAAALCVAPFLAAGPAGASGAGAGVVPRGAVGVTPKVVARPGTVAVSAAPRLPDGARALGTVAGDAIETGAVVLKPRNNAALQKFISEVTDKKSPMFHDYLKAGQFQSRFGPTDATIDSVKSQLQADGLKVTGVASDGVLVDFQGTARAVERAFGTGIERYQLAGGRIAQATTGAVKAPASIAGSVESVVGLDDLVQAQPEGIIRAPASTKGTHPAATHPSITHATGEADACSEASEAADEYGGLTDDEIANAYGATPLYQDGDLAADQTVAIYELEPFAMTDLVQFDNCYFPSVSPSPSTHVTVIPVDGGQPTGPGSGEAILDVENVQAIAPQATVDVYEAPNTTFGGLDEYAQIVNDDQAQEVTSSWGLCEQAMQEGSPGTQQAENIIFEQAAAQGESVFSAAGDAGSDDCNSYETSEPSSPYLSVDDPSSQPYVVAVGGTTIDDATDPPSEHVWNDGALWGAGGGGISESWVAPSWQASSTVPGVGNSTTLEAAQAYEDQNDVLGVDYDFCDTDSAAGAASTSTLCRELPDVVAQADEFTGAITIYMAYYGGWTTIGGTSSAAPLWAGMLALVNDSSTSNLCTSGTGEGVGFVSPLLYSVASNPTTYAESFNDLSGGNNDPYGDSNLYPATSGYDMATGLGSPRLTDANSGVDDAVGLASNLCAEAASVTRPAVSGLSVGGVSPAVEALAGGGTLTITGSNFCSDDTHEVASVTIGNVPVTTISVTCDEPTSTVSLTLPPASSLQPSNDDTNGAGAYQVIVTLADGESSIATGTSLLEYVDESSGNPVPTVTGVRTVAGSDDGGTSVDIFGTGFTDATAVSFGGASASPVTIVDDWEITATPPSESGVTCVQNGSSYDSAGVNEDASNDICQVEVQVTNGTGTSTDESDTILPLYEGAYDPNALGVIPAPAGEEAQPQPSEYDYLPDPTITSVTAVTGLPAGVNLAANDLDEYGGTLVAINGTGFNLVGLSAVYFGDDTQYADQDFNIVAVYGDELLIEANPYQVDGEPTITADAAQQDVSVQTVVATARELDGVTYAGADPNVTSLSIQAAVDTGGTPLTISGSNLSDVFAVEFVDELDGYPWSVGTQYNVDDVSDTEISTTTVPQNPSLVDAQACTATACSFDYPVDSMILYPPGNPVLTGSSAKSGPAHGGEAIELTGQNLGCVAGVWFGSVEAEQSSNEEAILDCGTTNALVVDVPPGTSGKTVTVTVETVESIFTGSGKSASDVTFTWKPSTPSAPTNFKVSAGAATATVRWGAPQSTGGDPVTSYRVTASTTGKTISATVASSKRSYTFAYLQPGVSWKFSVHAVSKRGAGLTVTSQPYTVKLGDNGYLVATANGAVLGFGSLSAHGGVGGEALPGAIVGIAATPDGLGYFEAGAKGAVYALGNAVSHGSASVPAGVRVVGIATTPDGKGYWLVANDGAVYSFGDAAYHGGAKGVKDVVGIASTADGKGYYVVEADGIVHHFGDAANHGDLKGKHVSSIVGIAADPVTGGYWLVSATGGIYSFDAHFYGAMTKKPNKPVVGMSSTPDGKGYWLLTSDGGIFSYGDAKYAGGATTSAKSAAVGITT